MAVKTGNLGGADARCKRTEMLADSTRSAAADSDMAAGEKSFYSVSPYDGPQLNATSHPGQSGAVNASRDHAPLA